MFPIWKFLLKTKDFIIVSYIIPHNLATYLHDREAVLKYVNIYI